MTASRTTVDNLSYCINVLQLATKLLEWEKAKAEQDIQIDETAEQTILGIAIDQDVSCAEVYAVLTSDERQKRDSILRSLAQFDASRDD